MADATDVVRVADARAAMQALIESRSLSMHELEADFPKKLAEVAWLIADAMRDERVGRDGKRIKR